MARFERLDLSDQDVDIDGNEYFHCKFENCNIRYSGGQPPSLSHCQFSGCRWEFIGAAANTMNFLKALYHGGKGFQAVVEHTLNSIRQ